jgi:hypothetical protein
VIKVEKGGRMEEVEAGEARWTKSVNQKKKTFFNYRTLVFPALIPSRFALSRC